MTDWQERKFIELLTTQRAVLTHLVQFLVAMVIGLVTIVGFAVNRESWGLAALGLLFEVAIILATYRYRSIASNLVDEASRIEEAASGDSASTRAIAMVIGSEDRPALSLRRLIAVITIPHVVFVLLAAGQLGWTFSGV